MIPGNKNFSRIFRNDLYIFQDEMSIEINKARSLVNYGGEQQALLVSRQRERERTLKEIQLRRETGSWSSRFTFREVFRTRKWSHRLICAVERVPRR